MNGRVVFIVVCFLYLSLLLYSSKRFRRCSASESGMNVVENMLIDFDLVWLLRPPQTFSTCFCLAVMLCDAWSVVLTWVKI